jgi:hypothetical protein
MNPSIGMMMIAPTPKIMPRIPRLEKLVLLGIEASIAPKNIAYMTPTISPTTAPMHANINAKGKTGTDCIVFSTIQFTVKLACCVQVGYKTFHSAKFGGKGSTFTFVCPKRNRYH